MTVKIVSRTELGSSSFDHQFSTIQRRVRKPPYDKGNYPEQVWHGMLQIPRPEKKEFFMAEVDSQLVGRIGTNIATSYPGKGYIGFFEVDVSHPESDAIAKALLESAGSWLKKEGAEECIGPMNYNTWFAYRFRVDNPQNQIFLWEPINPPEYVDYFKSFGMESLEVYQSRCSDKNEKVAEATEKSYQKALEHGFSFSPFEGEDFLLKNMEPLFKLSLTGFSKNYLYEPISFPEFQALYVPIFKTFDFSTGHLAKNEKGDIVAFCFSFRDGNNLVIKSIVVDPEYQGKGLSNALLHLCSKEAVRQGLIDFIGALFKKESISGNNLSVKSEVLWEHEYHLFSKKIT